MKNLLFLFFPLLLSLGCSKNDSKPTSELNTLSGTSWSAMVEVDERGNMENATISFISETSVNVKIGSETLNTTYSYNPKIKTGTINDGTYLAPFEIVNNDLILEIEQDYSVKFKRLK